MNCENYLHHIVNDYYKFCDRTNQDSLENSERVKLFESRISVNTGKSYIKIVSNGSVHSFIVIKDNGKFKAGDILKAASWASPAKNFSRGNINNPNSYSQVQWTGA